MEDSSANLIKRQLYKLLFTTAFTLFFIIIYTQHNSISRNTKGVNPFDLYNIQGDEPQPKAC